MLYLILICIFISATVIQLHFAWFFNWQPTVRAIEIPPASAVPVSVIICAKNEARNLAQFLPYVLQQNYPKELFEVIVVNDASTDNTLTVLEDLQKKFANLYTVHIPEGIQRTMPGKKHALQQGIQAARHNRLLLTDADCKPASDQWLAKMIGASTDIVLGYGAYEAQPGLLNKFIRWETLHTCMQYSSYAMHRKAYMGVGRNLSYTKSLLAEVEADPDFIFQYTQLPSGDDDLLINKIAHTQNVSVCLNKEAHTISLPVHSWKAWWKQKTRHVSTGKYYTGQIKSLLGLYALSHGLYWLTGLTLLCIPLIIPQNRTGLLYALTALFFIRLSCYWLLAYKWYRQLNEKSLWIFYPVGDLGWGIYNLLLSPYIFWKNKMKWK